MNIEIEATNLIAYKKSSSVGFNAILTKVIANVLADNPEFARLNSVLKRGFFTNRLMVAKNVSFSVAQDKMDGPEKVASVFILEDANLKSMEQIHQELLQTHELPLEELPIYKELKVLLHIPNFLQKIIFYLASLVPTKKSVTYGTVGFTNLGKGHINCVFPVTPKTIMFGVGAFRDKLVLRAEKVHSIKVFSLNMMFNHFVVDGKICSDFLSKIKESIESI